MSAQPTYAYPVEHPPRLLEHGLPPSEGLTIDDLAALPPDPYWTVEMLDGALLVSSPRYEITWDDLRTFPDLPKWKFELREGSLILTPNAPDLRHQSCAFSLAILLRAACPPDLKVVMAPFDYVPVPGTSIQPDVLVARTPIDLKRLAQAPVLAVEVLSPSTRRRDLHSKKDTYAKYGVEHYWIIDPGRPSIQAMRLRDGVYELVAQADAGGVFEVVEPVPVSFDPLVLLDE